MRITFIGQIANKATGLGKALNDIIEYSKRSNATVDSVDITNNKNFLTSLYLILKSKSDVFYFTPAGSIGGNIRDCIILMFLLFKNKRIILHFHNSNYRKSISKFRVLFLLNKFLLSKIDGIILLGNKHKSMFNDFDIPDNIFKIIHNGIDKDMFISEEKLLVKHNNVKKKIIYFSNMIYEKGYLDVLEIAKLCLGNNNYEFYFSGKFYDSAREQEFNKQIENMSNVVYINGVYGKDKAKLLHEMNFFILPSKYKDETLPISMLEAIGSGCYILITNVGVISEVINNETTTFIDNMNSKDIVDVLNEKSKILNLLNYNVEYYSSNFENNKVQEELFKFITVF